MASVQPKESSGIKGKLAKVANRIESIGWANTWVARWDRYADADSGPEGKPKTVCGGFLSLVMICVVIVVIAFNIYTLAKQEMSLSSGDPIHISMKDADFKVRGLMPVSDGKSMHYPVMNLDIASNLYMFEVDAPGIQKVRVADNTQYNPDYYTASQDPQTTKSIYAQVTVPFDSVDDNTGFLKGRFSAVTMNSNELYTQQLPSQFSQTVQTLELMGADTAVQNASYYPHTTHLYLRFDKQQLTQILDNQLDIVMFNLAEYDHLDSQNSSHQSIVTQLKTLSFDWHPWMLSLRNASNFNVLKLESRMTDEINSTLNSTVNPLNWQLKIQYSANFNYSLADFFCYNSSASSLNKVEFRPVGWVSAPNNNGTTIELDDAAPLLAAMTLAGVKVPFQMAIWDRKDTEKVTVTNINGKVLTIIRSDSIDFNATVNDPSCYQYEDGPFLNRMPIPVGWTCPADYYNDLFCDCDCGAVDMDCTMCAQNFNDNNAYCDIHTGNLTNTTVPIPMLAYGIVCEQGGVKLPGDGFTRGFFADPNLYNSFQCPEDTYYLGSATYFDNGTIWCNVKPTVQVVSDDMGVMPYVYQALTPISYYWNYNATYTMGKYSFDVSTYIREDNTLQVMGMPDSSRCEDKPHLPKAPKGFLRSALKFGQMSFLITPLSVEYNYLPPDGPYPIIVAGIPLTVSGASCPRDNDYAQVVVVTTPPDATLLTLLEARTHTAEVAISTDRNSITLPVRYSSADFANVICCWGRVTMAVGSGIDATLYDISNVTLGNATGPSCCDTGVTCTGDDLLYVHIAANWMLDYTQRGTEVSIVQEYDAEACTPWDPFYPPAYRDALSPVVGLSTLTAKPHSDGTDTLMYETANRYKNFPVQDLNVEAAMYIVPEKSGFGLFPALCYNFDENFTASSDPKSWSVQKDKYLTVHDCNLITSDSLAGASEPICQIVNCDHPELPPTNRFQFTQSMQINEKWNLPKKEIDQVNGPEYDIDVSTIYYFDYSGQDFLTGKQFSQRTPQEGDFDQDNTMMKFSGELDFIGRGNTTDPNLSLYPANAPILDFSAVINANTYATAQLLKAVGKYHGISKVQGWDASTASNFGNITLDWPDVLPLTLEPGYNYTFTAVVSIQPVFNLNLMASVTVERWVNSTSLSYTMVPAEFIHRNQANVRLQISFDDGTTALENKLDYTLLDFFLGLGSAIGLMGFGMMILGFWQDWTLTLPEEPEKTNPYHECCHNTAHSFTASDSTGIPMKEISNSV